ncbi:MAG: cell division protein SepF [Actinomycetota bacterium]|nr:cell division protein SepF [Actinomycetota bacterium]
MAGFMRKAMVFLGLDDEELDDYDASAYEPDVAVAPQGARRYTSEMADVAPVEQPRGIRPLPREPVDPSGPVAVPRPRAVVAMPGAKVHVVAPARFSDAQEIGDRFRGGQPVIVNLQTSDDPGLARRMIDFCSGVTYALSGSMDKVADQVFLLTPNNVEVSAEEKRRLRDQGLYRS